MLRFSLQTFPPFARGVKASVTEGYNVKRRLDLSLLATPFFLGINVLSFFSIIRQQLLI